MEILKLLQKKSKWFYTAMILFSLVNGFWNLGLLSIINTTIQGQTLPFWPGATWQLFLILIAISLASNKIFQNFMIRVTNNISYELGISVVDKVRFASFEDYEQLGKEKIYTALQDTQQISVIPRVFIECINAFIIVSCCFAYLVVIEPLGGILLLAMVIGIVIFFFYRNKSIERSFNVVRDLQDSYFAYLDDLLAGFKEIKMGISRNDNLFFKFLDKNRLQTKDLVISNQYKYVNNDLVGNYSLYLVIGFILFGLPLLQPSTPSNITTFVIAILYAIGPVTMLINFIPTYTRVKISVERLNEFDKKLQALKMINIKHGVPITNRAPLESIRFENVTYHYLDKNGDPGFALKPMNLEIKTGELIFVTGGNGSGKTTFSNLLTGIYKPTSGKIFYNNQEVTENHAAHYRDSFSAIFTNNHLFSENYDDFDLNKVNQNFSEYLDVMQLASIISWDKKRNKIDHRLSKGQGKRMAMIYAQLENRQLWMLDEWAADQDPEFRKYFYTVFLQNLKKEGKTVIVITHDDRYFHLAERIIKFDFGKIVQDTILTPAIAEVTI